MLQDILAEGLRFVICGTAAGTKSGQVGQYYAGRGNRFWRTLADVGLTPRLLAPSEAFQLLDFGIGLTDLIKGQSGPDSHIQFDRDGASGLDGRTELREKIERIQPGILCFNGKRAAQEFFGRRSVAFGLQSERIGRTRLFVASSTSAAANGAWDLSVWQELAALALGKQNGGL